MNINSVQQQNYTPEPTKVEPKKDVSKSSESLPKKDDSVPSTPSVKKDVAIISEQAKDLAALMIGKSVEEEANESQAAKSKENSSLEIFGNK